MQHSMETEVLLVVQMPISTGCDDTAVTVQTTPT
jgi:hypothetical protein